jgi:tetratricopeptide (TPR) repeat protein
MTPAPGSRPTSCRPPWDASIAWWTAAGTPSPAGPWTGPAGTSDACEPRLLLAEILLYDGGDPRPVLLDLIGCAFAAVESWRLFAGLLLRAGLPDRAVAACRWGLAHHPDDPGLLFLQGRALEEQGELLGAEVALLRLVATATGSELVCLSRCCLARMCQAQGRLADAAAHWRGVLAVAPDSVSARVGLAEIALARRQLGEVERAAHRLAAVPAPAEAALLWARLRLAEGDAPAARVVLEDALRRLPGAVELRELLAEILLGEVRDHAGAARAFRAVLAQDPDHAAARLSLRLLRRRAGRGSARAGGRYSSGPGEAPPGG